MSGQKENDGILLNLNDFRQEIDQLDDQLVKLLTDRANIAKKIGKYKAEHQLPVNVPKREEEHLQELLQKLKDVYPEQSIRGIFREVMSAAKAIQKNSTVAFLGPIGTFSHQAATEIFGTSVDHEVLSTITQVIRSTEKNLSDYSIIPIENSIEGSVNEALDGLQTTPLQISDELYMSVKQSIMSITGSLDKVKRVYSHSQGLRQCQAWLINHLPKAEYINVDSTAKAAEMAKNDPESAAIASEVAAELHSLALIARSVQDSDNNTTRFIVLSNEKPLPTGRDKTSLMFSVQNTAGALYKALGIFEKADVNLNKIENRPSKDRRWLSSFFVEVDGHKDEAPLSNMLENLKKHTTELKVLGSYMRKEDIN